jgi:hypothetical protein
MIGKPGRCVDHLPIDRRRNRVAVRLDAQRERIGGNRHAQREFRQHRVSAVHDDVAAQHSRRARDQLPHVPVAQIVGHPDEDARP